MRNGSQKDVGPLIKWLEQEASSGSATATAWLGLLIAEETHDGVRALPFLKAGSEAGYLRCQLYLARLLDEGKGGLAQNIPEAVKWYRLAADRGNKEALARLKELYDNGKADGSDDPSLASDLKFLEETAEAGDPKAQCEVAQKYALGQGVPKNMETCFRWLKKSAASGYHRALFMLGGCTIQGEGGMKKDPTAGWALVLKAAEIGNFDASFQVARSYRSGNGLKKDPVEALAWSELLLKRVEAMKTGDILKDTLIPLRDGIIKELTQKEVAKARARLQVLQAKVRPIQED